MPFYEINSRNIAFSYYFSFNNLRFYILKSYYIDH